MRNCWAFDLSRVVDRTTRVVAPPPFLPQEPLDAATARQRLEAAHAAQITEIGEAVNANAGSP